MNNENVILSYEKDDYEMVIDAFRRENPDYIGGLVIVPKGSFLQRFVNKKAGEREKQRLFDEVY